MAPILLDIPTPVPPDLQSPLEAHLPHSFTLLRRAQFTHFPGGTSPHAHFLFAYHAQSQKGDNPSDAATLPSPTPKHFAAAYLDLTQHPSTQMFLYSTLQDTGDDDAVQNLPQADVEQVLDLCAAVFRRVRHLAQVAAPETVPADRLHSVMVGNFHEATYRLLVERRGLASSYWNPHDVWLFRVDELPPPTAVVEEGEGGLVWSVVRREDVPLIASRTSIPKVAETLMVEPSLAVRDGAGRLVAWGFMGLAGTLSTLHVEVGLERA